MSPTSHPAPDFLAPCLQVSNKHSLFLFVYLHISYSGHEDKQCRYPASNNNMAPNMAGAGGVAGDPVMNYAASLATATSPGTNIAAAAHFYQQQVRHHYCYSHHEFCGW